MKNRNGFTLVELLAVIAILAILVIIALPNVINMYNKAQKQMFLTEAKKVYSESEKKYLTNAISGKNTKIINSEDSSKLDMTGKKLQYCVILNSSGKVTDMKVSNGKWVASLNGKAIEDLTIDDLEDGNLDDYECASATDESCFTYRTFAESEEDATPVVTIVDASKCKNFFVSDGAPEDIVTTLCAGDIYKTDDGAYTIQDIVLKSLSKDDYVSSGLNLKYLMIEKVEVVDTTKCKNYLQSKFGLEEDESMTLCTTSGGIDEKELFQIVSKGYIPFISYEKAGLKVTARPLSTGVFITKYDNSCGTDVVIPSMIDGKSVIGIDNSAFRNCRSQVNSTNDRYKVDYLNYNMDDEYDITKVEYCLSNKITSVSLPNSLIYIDSSAFSYNDLTEVTIPLSVRYIGSSAFYENKLQSVTFDGDVNNIKIYCSAFRGSRHSSKVNSIVGMCK